MVADHYCVEPGCVDLDGGRVDTSYFRLPPISAERLWKADHRLADCSGVHGGFGRGLSTSCVHSRKSFSDLRGDRANGIFRVSLFFHYFEAAELVLSASSVHEIKQALFVDHREAARVLAR